MYTLRTPRDLYSDMWYVGTQDNSSLYLRPDLTVQDGTGSDTSYNVGYWPTEQSALKAYNDYYRKYKPKLISSKE